MRKTLLLIIAWILSVILATTLAWHFHPQKEIVVSDTVVIVNTISEPIVKDSLITQFITRTLPVHDTCMITRCDTVIDSVKVEIPITRKIYQGEDYRAVISGYEAKLDTISVFNRTITNTFIKKAPRFGVGLTGGYGASKDGLSPFIGIGVYYNLISN